MRPQLPSRVRPCFNNATVPRRPEAAGWAPLVGQEPADYLPSGTVGQWLPAPVQWWTEQKRRRSENRPGGDDSDPGLASRRERGLTAPKRGTLEPAWALHTREGARRPWRRGATGYCRLSRQPLVRHGRTVACVSLFVSFVALISMGTEILDSAHL